MEDTPDLLRFNIIHQIIREVHPDTHLHFLIPIVVNRSQGSDNNLMRMDDQPVQSKYPPLKLKIGIRLIESYCLNIFITVHKPGE